MMYVRDSSSRRPAKVPPSSDRSTEILAKCRALADAVKSVEPKTLPKKGARSAAEEAGRIGAARAAAYAKWFAERVAIYKGGNAR